MGNLSKPNSPYFSSGPCKKPPFWKLSRLNKAILGRSHRSPAALERIQFVLDKTKKLLNLPKEYEIAILPGSATGAMESALWNLLGSRPVDVLSWDIFGQKWAHTIEKKLTLKNTVHHKAPFGELPQLNKVDFEHDVIFTWNGTTSGVHVPDATWIDDNRQGLTFCDAISAIFAYEIPWNKIDVASFGWQKTLGGEASQGMLILSPRAVERLDNYTPPWPIPSVLNLKKDGKINTPLFKGFTLNTPSMLCIEDWLQCLNWAEEFGGIKALSKKTDQNFTMLKNWVNATPWIRFLASSEEICSHTSPCLIYTDPRIQALSLEKQWDFTKSLCKKLEDEGVAYDIRNHILSVPGLRIWTGPTIDVTDLESLFPWITWSYEKVLSDLS